MLDLRRRKPSEGRRLVKSHRDDHWFDSKQARSALAIFVSAVLVIIPLVASRAEDDPTVSIATTEATASTATTLNATISNFPDANLIAVVVLTENNLQCTAVSTCGALQVPAAQQTGLTALLNHNWSNTVRLGFRGSRANVQSALAAFQWTPPAFNDSSTSAFRVQVSVTEVPADDTNLFYEPFQDHWYRWVQNGTNAAPVNITWMNARLAARQSVLSTNGLVGYLSNITSSTENDFIQNYTNAQNIWIGAADAGLAHPSFDPNQAANSSTNLTYTDDDAEEGAWRWADGPEHGQQFYKVTGCSQGLVDGFFTHEQSCLSNSNGWTQSTPSINTSVLGGTTTETVSRRTSGSWVITKIGALRTSYSGDNKAYTNWAGETNWGSLSSPSAQTWGTEPNTYNSNQNNVTSSSTNWPPGENAAVTNWGGNNGRWNDLHQSNLDTGINVSRYLIEYGGTNCSPGCGTNTLDTATVTQRVTTLPDTFVRTCDGAGTIQNGSFENASSGNPTDWRTTAVDGAFERWSASLSTSSGQIGAPSDAYAAAGSFLMELQANNTGGTNQGLYQDISTIPGTVVRWSYRHHFRTGVNSTDQISAAVIGPRPQGVPAGSIWTSSEQGAPFGSDAPTGLITGNSNYSTSPYQKTVDAAPGSTSSWRTSSGTYSVPAGQTTTRFLFAAIQSPANGYGNLIDDVTFTPTLACPMTLTIVKDRSRTINLQSTAQVTTGWNYYAPAGTNAISVIRGPSEVTRTFGTATSANSPLTLSSSTVGSYSMLYKLTDAFNQVSYSNLTINVVDEVEFNAPTILPVDPRVSSVNLPQLHIADNSAVLMCLDQLESATSTTTISSPTISISNSGDLVSGVSTSIANNVRNFSGSSTVVRDQTSKIRVSANSGRLLPDGESKFVRIRVTSTSDGSSNCANGSSRVVELKPFGLDTKKVIEVRLD